MNKDYCFNISVIFFQIGRQFMQKKEYSFLQGVHLDKYRLYKERENMIVGFDGRLPAAANTCYLAETATIIGDVHLDEHVSIWFGAVIRGDIASIKVGANSNIQDNATLHGDERWSVSIGENVTVGHNAVIHGAVVEDNVIIGMHATVLNGAHIGENCIIGAGALVTEGTIIPEGSIALGVPAKVVGHVTSAQIERIRRSAEHYIQIKEKYQ